MVNRARSVVSTAARVSLLLAAAPWLLIAACGQKGPLIAAKPVAASASVPAASLRPIDAPGALLPASGPR
jgi:hypothetical protein